MRKWKSNLDEQQEQTLLKIEHRGCWLAFWGLLAALVVETVLGKELRDLAGEWVVFMALALYLSFACAKNGIWSRSLKMSVKNNVLISLAAGVAAGAMVFGASFTQYHSLPGSLAAGVITAVISFLLCLLALALTAEYTKRRHAKLEAEPKDTDQP